MFEQAVLSNGPASKRVWTTFAGVTGQALLVTMAVTIPMIWPETMPGHQALLRVFMPSSPLPPPPKDPMAPVHMTRTITRQLDFTRITEPASIPKIAAILVDPPPTTAGVSGGVEGGVPGGVPNGVVGSVLNDMIRQGTPTVAAPPRPIVDRAAPAETKTEPQRVVAGGRVQLAEPIFRPEPAYPPLARQMRVQGVVELQGVIGVDGHIKELRVVSGHPLLTKAAIEAVQRWVYRPTTLNEKPVEVIAPITVAFRLN